MGPKGEVRSPFMSVIFTVISFGFYGMYWWWKMASEINAFLGEDRLNIIKFALFSFFSCGLYGVYFTFVEGKAIIKEVQAKAGQPQQAPFALGLPQMQTCLNNVWENMP